MEPWSAAFSAFGPALTASAQPGGPSHAAQSTGFDSSGWSVNINSAGASATATKTSLPSAGQALNAAGAGVASLLGSPVVLIGLVLLYAYMHKK
jgi:hypothetical protein